MEFHIPGLDHMHRNKGEAFQSPKIIMHLLFWEMCQSLELGRATVNQKFF